jgi:formylglycine-generating enzyme required for sulfatase activity
MAAFGRALGVLPDATTDVSKDQKDFLNQAIQGLAQEGKVNSVRLALFAEMMKGRSWTPATLKEVGGTEGVGVTFLDETFSAATAPPEHRYHQKAARAVLQALLPESGTDIKGHMRSYTELLEASGYGSRPREFEELIRILDGELRLITPTDPEGKDEADQSTMQTGVKYYQLTHDYLVPSLRDWLTRKQKETRRGRAELLLADRAAVWNARPENRQLPSLLQWFQIRWLTARKTWTPPQRKMMTKASRYHAVRVVILASCLVLLSYVSREGYGRLKAQTLRDRLLECTTAEVPLVVKDMAPYRSWVNPLLKDAYTQAEETGESRKQLHASLALLPVDSRQVKYLYERLLKAEPQEFVVIRGALFDHKQDLTEQLWTLLENPQHDPDQRLRAACGLSVFAPDDPRWGKAGGSVAEMLVNQEPFVVDQWTAALKDARTLLLPPLADFLTDQKRSLTAKRLIARAYGTYATDTPDAYARLEKQLDENNAPDASDDSKIALAAKQASIGTALLVMGRGEKVWPLLQHRPDPTLRSCLIEWSGPVGVEAKMLTTRLNEERAVSARRAILLSLGEYGLGRLSRDQRLNLLPRLLQLYGDDPDPGIHGAAEWLLRKWEASDKSKEIDKALATGKVEGQRQWYINRQGQTMVVVPKPGEFWMGEGESERNGRHRVLISRSFAIATKAVTVEQFLRFRREHGYFKGSAPSSDCPVNGVSWYDAAAYCNWLSEQEGIPKEQWCYEASKAAAVLDVVWAVGQAGSLPTPLWPVGWTFAGWVKDQLGEYDKMTVAPNYLHRTGYRLPTEAEREYACRAGAETGYSFGEPVDLLGKYGWYAGNSLAKSQPVGQLKPNDLGLFDMHGNSYEWTQDVYKKYGKGGDGKATEDTEDINDIDDVNNLNFRVMRGGSHASEAAFVRSEARVSCAPANRDLLDGFRPARTFP